MANATDSGDKLVGFVPEPRQRGTIGLVTSCLFTIVICVWNTLHMNLPADDESPMRIFFHKLKWMVIALLAPEFLFPVALDELLVLKEFREDLRRLERERPVRCTAPLLHAIASNNSSA